MNDLQAVIVIAAFFWLAVLVTLPKVIVRAQTKGTLIWIVFASGSFFGFAVMFTLTAIKRAA